MSLSVLIWNIYDIIVFKYHFSINEFVPIAICKRFHSLNSVTWVSAYIKYFFRIQCANLSSLCAILQSFAETLHNFRKISFSIVFIIRVSRKLSWDKKRNVTSDFLWEVFAIFSIYRTTIKLAYYVHVSRESKEHLNINS